MIMQRRGSGKRPPSSEAPDAPDAPPPPPRQPGTIDPSLVGEPEAPIFPSRPSVRTPERPSPIPGMIEGEAFRPVSRRNATRMTSDAEDEAAAAVAATAPPPRKSSRWGRVFWLFIIMVAGFLVYDTGRVLVEVWQTDWIGATALSVLGGAFVLALISATLTELRALRRLSEVDRFRAALDAALAHDSPGRLRRALEPILALVRTRRPELVKAFGQRTQGLTESDAVMKQFRGAVLAPLDQEARRTVRANALAVMGATAVSPHPALDVVIVLWRSTVMVRRVAEVYGLRPSGLATIKLTKQVVVSAAIAVAADPTGDIVANTLGGGLAEKISARFAEGSISGLRAMRLGVRAIETCRPLPFEPEERKGMWHTLTQG